MSFGLAHVLRERLKAAAESNLYHSLRDDPVRAPAAKRMLERAAAGFVVNVCLTLRAISKCDLGGGEHEPHPHGQFFALVSSASEVSSKPATAE